MLSTKQLPHASKASQVISTINGGGGGAGLGGGGGGAGLGGGLGAGLGGGLGGGGLEPKKQSSPLALVESVRSQGLPENFLHSPVKSVHDALQTVRGPLVRILLMTYTPPSTSSHVAVKIGRRHEFGTFEIAMACQ